MALQQDRGAPPHEAILGAQEAFLEPLRNINTAAALTCPSASFLQAEGRTQNTHHAPTNTNTCRVPKIM